MKSFSFVLLFLSIAFSAFAQDYNFSALQGLKYKDNIWFEISGYSIYVGPVQGKINDKKTVNALKKKYKINSIQAEYSDTQLNIPNRIIEDEDPVKDNPTVKINHVYYLLQKSKDEMTLVMFQTLNQRDILFEKEFVTAWWDGALEEYISEDWTGNSISFAGRLISLGTACGWKSPHNLYCKGGQISWSEFPSAEAAELDLDAQILANNTAPILSNDYVDVLFEDIPTIAYRVVYEKKGSYYPLIVYYISQEVRGKYVSCVMSNYGYNRQDYRLSILLQQFMSIPDPPDWAYNEFDVPQYESYVNNGYNPSMPVLEIGAGTFLPLGNLSDVYAFAPSLNFSMGVPIKSKMSIDLAFNFAFPVNTNRFIFHYEGEKDTQAKMLLQMSLRYHYMNKWNEKWGYGIYGGIGLASIMTDLLKEITEDGQKTYHEIDAVDFYGGGQLLYRHVGCFLEYHYAPYDFSKNISNDFGKSFLNVGLFYRF